MNWLMIPDREIPLRESESMSKVGIWISGLDNEHRSGLGMVQDSQMVYSEQDMTFHSLTQQLSSNLTTTLIVIPVCDVSYQVGKIQTDTFFRDVCKSKD